MSRPQPSPRAGLMQNVLLMLMLGMGFMLIFNSFQRPPDPRNAEQVLEQMRQLNRELRDVTIAQVFRAYEEKVRSEGKTANAPAADIDRRVLQGVMLVTDTQYKAAVFRNDMGRLNLAYTTLATWERRKQGQPIWSDVTFSVERPRLDHLAERFPATRFTFAEQEARVRKELSARSERDLIVGVFPGYAMIDALVRLTGKIPAFSYAFAAFLLAVIVRAIIWPLAQRQLMHGRQMMQLQPMVREIQEKYGPKGKTGMGASTPEVQQKVMELYKEYGINPLAGCFPALLQLPLFLLVYQCMLHYRFEFKNGTFLWINPATSASTNGFVAPSLGDMDYILLVLYGISMVVTALLAPISDPNQIRQQRILGLVVAVTATGFMFFYPLPSAFVLYWFFTNVLSTIQSLLAYRAPLPPLEKVAGGAGFGPNGGVLPRNGMPPNGKSPSTFGNTGAPRVQRAKKKRR